MATQTNLFRFRGRIGNVRGYKLPTLSPDYAGLLGGPTKDQILNDPNFARTRENMSEFGGSAMVGRVFRVGVAGLKFHQDPYFTGRLTAAMYRITRNGPGPRGEREILITTNHGELEEIEFHRLVSFDSIVLTSFTMSSNISRNQSTLFVPSFDPFNLLDTPAGATHFRMLNAAVALSDYDFDAVLGYVPKNATADGVSKLTYGAYLPVNVTAANQTIVSALPGSPTMTNATLVTCVGIEFYQQVGPNFYLFAQNNATKIDLLF